MKKLLLSLAMVATMGISVGASAVVDLESSTPNPVVLASELSIPGTGITLNATAAMSTDLNMTTEIGFGYDTSDAMGIRLSLDNGATFSEVNPPTIAITGCLDGDVGAMNSIDGNTPSAFPDDAATVVWSLTNTCGTELPIDTVITFTVPEVNIVDQSTVAATYSAHNNGFAANANESPAGVETGVLISFAPVLDFDADPAMGTAAIDVTQDSLFFAGGTGTTTTPFGVATLTLDNTTTLDASLSAITVLDDIVDLSTSSLTVTGNFSSADMLGCGGAANIAADDVLSGGDAVFDGDDVATGNSAAQDTVTYDCQFETDGTTIIEETIFELSAELAGATGFADQTFGPFTMSEFDKNGSSAEIDILFNAGATSSQIRILNKSSIDGDVTITLINDGGDSVTFPLSAVQPFGLTLSNTLAAGEATPNLPMSDLIIAARTVDAAFAQTSFRRNKYRVVVDAEFGDNADPVRVQAVNFSTTLNALSVN